MMHFDFGKNWQEFSAQRLDADRVSEACRSLQSLLQIDSISGVSFLDVGCGSGLFSIAAHQLGATKVVGIDINPRCVETARSNRDRLAPKAPIEFHVASALDHNQVSSLGCFDLIYAWGSLHHTGSMWDAIRNVAECVKPQGILILAIYNKHITSPIWNSIKWLYNRVPGFMQKFMVYCFAAIIYGAKFVVTGSNPFAKERGMDFWFDVVDWVGGYPYEYATPGEIDKMISQNGFTLRRFVAAQVPTGCNEFVFCKLTK